MVFVHTGVVSQPTFHRSPRRAVLDAITQMMVQSAIVSLGNDFHADDAIGRQQDLRS